MQNFSPLGNLINSFLKQQASRAASNIVVGGTPLNSVQTPEQNATPKPLQQQPLPQQMNLDNKHALAQMENTERAILVKELLNLPPTLKELVTTLQNAKPTQNTQLQNINVAMLMQLMQTNGKEALSKIMHLSSLLNKQGNIDNNDRNENIHEQELNILYLNNYSHYILRHLQYFLNINK